jgi:hypothetical protein
MEALLTAFITNTAFIVLLMLVELSKELIQRHGSLNDEGRIKRRSRPDPVHFPNAAADSACRTPRGPSAPPARLSAFS